MEHYSLPAAAYVPPEDPEAQRWMAECIAHIRYRGWRLVAVAHDPDAVAQLWVDRRIQRVVVALPEHRDRLVWAVEVVIRAPADRPAGTERPRWLR